MSLNTQLLRTSFELVVERAPDLTHRFYAVLFERYPQTQAMFSPSRRGQQENMLTQALVAVMDHLDDAPWLVNTLRALGARHVNYGVTDEMYGWVAESLLITLEEVAGAEWSPELANAWTEALTAIAGLMQAGAHAALEESAAPTDRMPISAPAPSA
jgi:hemoglobin-like flavoprotein